MGGVYYWLVAAYHAASDNIEPFAQFMEDNSIPVTFGVAITLVFLKILSRLISGARPCATSGLCIDDFLNGCLIVPFGTMCMSAISPTFLNKSSDGRLIRKGDPPALPGWQ